MSKNHGAITASEARPAFLKARPGDVVIVWEHPELMGTDCSDWWMAEVLYTEGSARDPEAPSLFQVIDIDTGVIRWVNADCIQQLLLPVSKPVTGADRAKPKKKLIKLHGSWS